MRTTTHWLKVAGAGFICLLLLSSCSANKPLDTADSFMEKWRARAQESRGHSPGPASTPEDLVKEPAVKPPEDRIVVEKERPLPTKRISMTMSNVDVAVLLRALARAAEVNIILNNKVTGRANINITQAPWDQVFLSILRTHNLSYAWQGDIVRIMTADDLEEELRKETRRRELQISEPTTTRIVPVKFGSAEKLQENMKNFLSVDKAGKPVGSILVDQHSNALIVNAVPRDINTILSVLETLDKPTPQVLIEAFIVEANRDVARELGVQWGGAVQVSGGDKRSYLTGRDNGALGTGQDVNTGVNPTAGNVVNLPLSAARATSLGFIYQNVGKALLAAQLTALQDEGKLNILSSPSITTLDNQQALIESGRDIPFQTVEDGEVNIEYKKAVLSLKVTPHVIDSQTIKLGVSVKKDEVDFSQPVLGNPTIVTKNAETNVIQFDGQTLVIGGLNKETSSDGRTGTPGLLNVPMLGWLFKTEAKRNEKEDLLIFITPTILKPQASGAAAR